MLYLHILVGLHFCSAHRLKGLGLRTLKVQVLASTVEAYYVTQQKLIQTSKNRSQFIQLMQHLLRIIMSIFKHWQKQQETDKKYISALEGT